ncbi:MoaD/ThiS family protein [Candidatus Bathyarchaeota archaeon]|nr:MAG: MoaD/ThiS family protein [Candidatus Bathyarchaeota archaeon]
MIFKKGSNNLRITIRFYGIAYENTGTREWIPELKEKATIGTLLRLIVEQFPQLNSLVFDKEGRFSNYLSLAVNNVDILGLNGSETVLLEGDIVFVMPPIGGG